MGLSVEAVVAIVSVAVALPLTIALFAKCYRKWWRPRVRGQDDVERLLGGNDASMHINSYPIHSFALHKYLGIIGYSILHTEYRYIYKKLMLMNKPVCAAPIPIPYRSRYLDDGSWHVLVTLQPGPRSPAILPDPQHARAG